MEEKECEGLKAENRELKAYRDAMEQADFKGSFDKKCVENRELIAKLEKIKEIANSTYNDGVWNGFEMPEKLRTKIIQIISEVENENKRCTKRLCMDNV